MKQLTNPPPGVIMTPLSDLKPYKRNARTHSDKQVQQIANSIKRFGFMNPVLIDDKGGILAGHGRVEAAKRLGLTSVPTIRTAHLSDVEKRAYILADNKIAANAGWDKDMLRVELAELSSLDVDFDLEITGFGTAEIDVLIDGPLSIGEVTDDEEEVPEPETDKPAITQPGDVWQLGKHRLVCGDALEPETYKALMQGKKAHMVFTDPPYNVPVNGHVGGLGKTKHREFAMASGEMSPEEFIAAEKTHRCARVIELDPHYCDVILRRWRDHTGEEPVHSASGKTFNEYMNEGALI